MDNWVSQPHAFDFADVTNSGFESPSCWTTSNSDFWIELIPEKDFLTITVLGNTTGYGTINYPLISFYEGENCNISSSVCDANPLYGYNRVQLFPVLKGVRILVRIMAREGNVGTFGLSINNYNLEDIPGPDCVGAMKLYDTSSYSYRASLGAGQFDREPSGTCISAGVISGEAIERNSAWFTWIADSTGTLAFDIIPTYQDFDIDFVVYKMPTKSCSDITAANAIRCMASGGAGCMGPTGLSLTSEDLTENLDCNPGDDNYLKYLDLEDGLMYALVVNNFSDNGNDFTINFNGTGKFLHANKDIVYAYKPINCVDDYVTFNTSVPEEDVLTYNWDFGPGASQPNSTQRGGHTMRYDEPGVRIVTLELMLTDSSIVTDYVFVDRKGRPKVDAIVKSMACNGDDNASIKVFPIENNFYQYYWYSPFVSFESEIENIEAGQYYLNVSPIGFPECDFDTNFTITEPEELILTILDVQPEVNGDDGEITFSVSGGTEPYTHGILEFPNGNTIYPTDTNIVNLKSADYTIAVRDNNGCFVSIMTYVPSEIGLFEFNKRLKIYPNPIGDLFEVSFFGTGNIKVYDIHGRLIFRKSKVTRRVSISSKVWAPGIYFVRLEKNGTSIMQKVVK